MLFFGPISSVLDITTYLVMWFVFAASTPLKQTLFQSGWFVEGLLTQTLIVHMIGTPKVPFLQSRASAPLLVATGVIIAVGIFLPMGPLAGYFKLQALPGAYFPILVVIVLGYMALTQLVKGFYERRSAGSKVTTNWQVFVGQVCRRLALWSYHVGDDNTERTSSHKSSRRSPASTMRRHRTNHRLLFDGCHERSGMLSPRRPRQTTSFAGCFSRDALWITAVIDCSGTKRESDGTTVLMARALDG